MLSTRTHKTGHLSFKKNHRLLNSKNYKTVFDGVEYKQGGGYFTFLSKENQLSRSRLGIVAAKKHIPLAVNRNKIKRAIRESFRHHRAGVYNNSYEVNTDDCLIEQEKLKMFFDTVVLVKAKANLLSNIELKKELEKQWLKLSRKQN